MKQSTPLLGAYLQHFLIDRSGRCGLPSLCLSHTRRGGGRLEAAGAPLLTEIFRIVKLAVVAAVLGVVLPVLLRVVDAWRKEVIPQEK